VSTKIVFSDFYFFTTLTTRLGVEQKPELSIKYRNNGATYVNGASNAVCN